jgi:4-hydroxy 2-oxovalerate aldolase
MNHKIKILDCTLRDGGYYNNWNFKKSLVNSYVNAINNLNIDVVEVGFRFLIKKNYHGIFAHITDEYICKLNLNPKTKIAVMINASDLIQNTKKISAKNLLFFLKNKKKGKAKTRITYVRLAVHFKEVKFLVPYLKEIKNLGYKVMVNLMQSSDKTKKNFKDVIFLIKKTKAVDVLYFADSLGCLNAADVKKICFYLKKFWQKEFGFHAHNNMGKALSNVLEACRNGARWIDGTFQGMGRGAGNVETETLLKEFYFKELDFKQLEVLTNLVKNEFEPLKRIYGWGYSIFYYLGALHRIHPSYMQTILEKNKYSNTEIIYMISELKKINSSSYDSDYLFNLKKKTESFRNCTDISKFKSNDKILIVAHGDNLKVNSSKVINFIKRNKPTVLSLNLNKIIDSKYINYYMACNGDRILLDLLLYKKLKKPLVFPKNIYGHLKININPKKIINYGLQLNNEGMASYAKYCQSTSKLVLEYALCFAIPLKPKEIYFAGFDGYADKNINAVTQSIISNFKSKYDKIHLKTLTKSCYTF